MYDDDVRYFNLHGTGVFQRLYLPEASADPVAWHQAAEGLGSEKGQEADSRRVTLRGES